MAETKKLKIGILTFWWSQDNYGQLLQCYALQKYLRDRGHEPFLIRYYRDKNIAPSSLCERLLKALNPFRLYAHLCRKIRMTKNVAEQKKHDRHFDDFRSKYITWSECEYDSYIELKKCPPNADVYIVGSDQVWNTLSLPLRRFKNPLHAYFLDFGSDHAKRISYAASRSLSDALTEDYKFEIQPLLARFDYVSVREEALLSFCAECGCTSAEQVCDPTLLLEASDYRKLYSENEIRKPKYPYLLVYMLGNETDFSLHSAFDFAKGQQLEVVYVTGNAVVDGYEKYFATIPEWLYLVDNATFVITNSFHCGVFSTIFHKQFGIIPLSGKVKGMNARFENLFKLCKSVRYVSNTDFSVLKQEYKKPVIDEPRNFLSILEGRVNGGRCMTLYATKDKQI